MPRRWSHCYLCGGEGARTSDHVFASSLFPVRLEVMITAPAHKKCNAKLAADETYFRVFALSGLANDAARTLWEGPVRRSFKKDPAFLANIARQISRTEIRSPAGLYLGAVPTITADAARIQRVLEKHVRGLLYHHYQEILPNDAEFSPHQLIGDPSLPPVADDVMRVIQNLSPAVVLGDSVTYRFGKPADEASLSMWLLMYFRRQAFLVMAGPAGWIAKGGDGGGQDDSAPPVPTT